MTRIKSLLLFLLISGSLFAQDNYINISGVIKRAPMNWGDTLAVEKVEVILAINDTLKLMALSNKNGHYEFNLKSFKANATLSCRLTKKSMLNGRTNPCIFVPRDNRIIDMNKANGGKYIADFMLREGCCFTSPPIILFKANSLDYERDSLLIKNETPVSESTLLQLLTENPNTVIEIAAHCDSKEKNKKELSLKRAELVQQALIKKGIETTRIKIKGLGDAQPIVSEKVIKASRSPEERDVLRLRNRRVEIKVLSFDPVMEVKPAPAGSKTGDE